jgi:hypothetical protein
MIQRERHVRMVIGVDGRCAIDAINFSNASCLQATRQISDALAGGAVCERLKAEAVVPPARRGTPQESSR